MTAQPYNWKRYWIPRDGGFSFDSQGFLLPPASDAEWARYWKTDAVGFDALLGNPCLVFLGEPGIGKSYAIRHALERTRAVRKDAGATILFRELSSYITDTLLVDDVFKSQEFASWQQHGGELHVFLDSFDECLQRVDSVAELLATQLERLPSVQNLFFRIASRTAEWRAPLEDALRGRWGKESVGVYELAPLTRDQVLMAATVHLSKPEQFVEDVIVNEVVSFAIKPLTLDLLIRVWQEHGGSLPPTQREIYQQGSLALCSDSEKRQTPKLRRELSAEQRLAVAAHIAAATFFCNRAAVWTGASEVQKPAADLSLAELATGFVTVKGQRVPVSEPALRETLDTGLFTSRGRNRLGWAHQTYGEFLAARYLLQEGLTARQALDLLTHPHDADRKLIPQLQEVAAWAAVPGTELFNHLARVQPDVLLRSDVATADTRHKSALVEALMAAFAHDTVESDWWGMRKRFRKLAHPGLVQQLRGHLSNGQQAAEARVEAIAMVEACELHALIPLLAKLAINSDEAQAVRRWAAVTVAKSTDAKSKKRLRPLALGQTGTDPDDELRGAGLMACWPEHLTADELFSSLTEPNDRIHGLYHAFLRDGLARKLAACDMPAALAWVESCPKRDASFDGRYGRLVTSILDRAADHIEAKGVLSPLASALLSRLRKHDFSHGTTPASLIKLLETRPDLRLKLAETMVQFFEDSNRDSMLMTRWGLRLLVSDDLTWLIERMQSAPSPELQRRFAHLVSWVFYPDDARRIDAVLEAAETSPVLIEVMPVWLKPMAIDSDEARKARERHLDEQRHRKEVEKQRKPELLCPPPAERLIALLDQFEGGDIEAWWKLYLWLEIKDDGHWCEKHQQMDIRELAGWKGATDVTKARMVAAAERYVVNRSSQPEEWFSRRNIRYHPAVAGFRALLLLANENPSAYEALPREVWQQWVPAVLRPHCYDERDEHRLLIAKALERSPEDAADWIIKVINEENKEGDNLWILQKLPESWSDALGAALLRRLREGRLKPSCFAELLSALLEQRVPGAVEFLRSKVPLKLRADKKRRQTAVLAARLLMRHGEPGDWPRVWNLIGSDAAFGKILLEGFAHEFRRSPAGIMKTLTESEVGTLWEWMLAQYPCTEDPDQLHSGEVTERHAMADLRNSLISHLGDIGTAAGCGELQRLITKYPRFEWFRRVLIRGQEQLRRLTWQPASPSLLFQLATNNRARLVDSGDQLLEVILESLRLLQARLQGETPLAPFLWNGKKPKREEDISEWVKIHLEDDLKGRGVVLGREVQIHRFDRTDIHVTAVTTSKRADLFGTVKVIIEIKGDWHRELKTAMETQLVARYLKDNDCRHGLYLVGWFKRAKGDAPASAMTLGRLQNQLAVQAASLTNGERTIKALVLDCSIAVPASKKRPGAKAKVLKGNRPGISSDALAR